MPQVPENQDPRFPSIKPQAPAQDQPQQPQPLPPETTLAENISLPQVSPVTTDQDLNSQNQNDPNLPQSKTKSKGKILKALIFAFIFIIFLCTSSLALAYTNYPLLKPPQAIKNALDNVIVILPIPKPTRIILQTAAAKSAQLKSADQKTQITLSSKSQNSPITSAQFEIRGPIEFGKDEKRATEADISGEVKFEGASLNGSASVKTIGNTLYFRINEFPFGSIYASLLPYKDKWYFYKFDESENQKQLYNNVKLKEIVFNFIEKSQKWTTSKSDNNVYLLTINPPKSDVDKFIYDIISSFERESQDKVNTISQQEKLTKITEKLTNFKITAEVDKKTFYLAKAQITMDATIENFAPPKAFGQESLLPTNNLVFNIGFSTEFSNYNKNIVIVPPDDAQDIKKALEDFSNSYLPTNSKDKLEESTPGAQLNSPGFNNLLSPDEEVLGEQESSHSFLDFLEQILN